MGIGTEKILLANSSLHDPAATTRSPAQATSVTLVTFVAVPPGRVARAQGSPAQSRAAALPVESMVTMAAALSGLRLTAR